MFHFIKIAIVFTVVTFIPYDASAGFSLKKAFRDIKKVVKLAPKILKVIPNPISTQIDIVTGKTKPKDIIKREGKKIEKLTEHVRVVERVFNENVNDLAGAVGGDVGKIIVQISNGPNRYAREFVLSNVSAAGSILQGEDPLIALATPLSAAIRDARAKYIGNSRPVPPEFLELFADIVPHSVLNRAKYNVGAINISLPNIINSGQKMFGNDHAVVVDDVIVFSKEPNPNNANDIYWFAHELHHVYQYEIWGVDKFALNYLGNNSRIEAEANQAAQNVYQLVMRAGGGNINKSFVSASMHGNAETINTKFGTTQIYVPRQSNAFNAGVFPTDQCIVAGENVYVLNTNAVISPMRFNQIVGQRISPEFGGCAFEMLSNVGRYCVSSIDGTVFAMNVQFPVGQCRSCADGSC